MVDNVQSKDPSSLDAANSGYTPPPASPPSLDAANSGYTPPLTNPPPYSAHPPQPQYGVQTAQPVQVTTVVPGAVVIQQMVGSAPTHTTCRACNMNMVTRIERKPTTRTHIIAAILCLIGCWPCACCTYCIEGCLSVDHYCTNCGAFVGTYMR